MLIIWLTGAIVVTGLSLGWRQAGFSATVAILWFIIAMVLLARPPAVPEVDHSESVSVAPIVTRKDLLPVLPMKLRLRISLAIANGVYLAIWMILGLR